MLGCFKARDLVTVELKQMARPLGALQLPWQESSLQSRLVLAQQAVPALDVCWKLLLRHPVNKEKSNK